MEAKLFRSIIARDLARMQRFGLSGFLRAYFHPQGDVFPYVFWFRVEQALRRGGWFKRFLSVVFYPIYRHYEFKYGIHLNLNIEVGSGLYIVHGDGVYLNCERIGKNLTVYQGVTIGIDGKSFKKPIVGDNVTVYPHALVVGDITIGDNGVVGALSFVSKSVEPGQRVCGAPARVMAPKG